ncbi:MAG TPA: acetylornithine transaminase, partial [Terriglobales bacterium]|nr:acetylornithine transaminase [Terriglobales bacterium]
ESEVLLPTYDRLQILVDHGAGVYLYGADGRKYLDFLSGIGVNALGYSHPAITKVLTAQAKKLVHVSNLFFHPYTAELATRLAKISGLDRVFFTNSGTEAWEGALKFARAYAQHMNKNGSEPRWRMLALENSFHGRTMGSLATTGQPKYQKPFVPLMPGVEFVRFNDVYDLKKKFDHTVCAICIEPIQGEGGVRPVSKEFMEAARELTKKAGALLILDEIQSGMGRTGKYFAFQHFGIKPDVVTLAKPIAGGLPLGAILTTDAVSSCLHPGMHGTTFGGGPLACAVALEVLKQIDKKKLLAHNEKLGVYFRKQLSALQKKHACVTDVRGMGLFVAAELDSADLAKATVAAMLEKGIIINRTNETVLRFLPPYIIEKKHVDQVVKALDGVLLALTKQKARAVAR